MRYRFQATFSSQLTVDSFQMLIFLFMVTGIVLIDVRLSRIVSVSFSGDFLVLFSSGLVLVSNYADFQD